MEDLPWFRQAWEAHVQRFHHGLAPEVLVGGLRKYCMPRAASRMIEPARDPGEAWRILESYFDRQTRVLGELISVVNDSQTLAHYSRILMAIREAKEIGRLLDLLTDSRIKALMEVPSLRRRATTGGRNRWGCAPKIRRLPSTPS